MKSTFNCLAVLLLLSIYPHSSQAQFLKQLINNAKQSMSNKASSNAASAVPKPDSTAKTPPAYDSNYISKLMANSYKPKTGPSISQADSAAAINSFRSGTGGNGLFYQYRINYTFNLNGKDSSSRDTMSTAMTDNHNFRTEFGIMGLKIQSIGHGNDTRYSMLLYPQSKTYSLNIIDTAIINGSGGMNYQVVKIGNETIQGYHCIHSKLTTQHDKKNIVEMDMWTTTEVPGYAEIKKLMTNQHITPKMLQALDQAGCDGFLVKMSSQNKSFSMEMLLIQADRKNLPASLFQIPPGYVQAENGNMMTHLLQPH